MTEITAIELKDHIANSPVPLLVDIFSAQCGPCRQLAPILDELAVEFHGKVTFLKLNALADPEATQICADLGVRNVPTLLIFNSGAETSRRTGAASKSELHAWVEGFIDKPND